jgi:hypothetical protein
MLAAHRDQENLVHSHQVGAKPQPNSVKGLQPKTPGARYPKTPLKIPVNDENVVHVLGGKSVNGGKSKMAGNTQLTVQGSGRNGLVTPLRKLPCFL